MTGSDHYFTARPASAADRRTIVVELSGRTVEVETAAGIFSPGHVDLGSRVLLRTVPPPPPSGELLDLGCGWGPLALTMAAASPAARVWAVDVNERALDLVRRNAARLSLANVVAATPDEVPAGLAFATVWSNPPIRVGKEALHALLLRWLDQLVPDGECWLVVGRHLGADPLQDWLTASLGGRAEVGRAASAKGFRVLRVART